MLVLLNVFRVLQVLFCSAHSLDHASCLAGLAGIHADAALPVLTVSRSADHG
jgi:hypothetical protein